MAKKSIWGKTKSLLAYFRYEFCRSGWSMAIVLMIFILLTIVAVSIAKPFSEEEDATLVPAVQFSFSFIDEDNSLIGDVLKENLSGTPYIKEIIDDDLTTALERLKAGETALALHIPEDFFQEVRTGSGDLSVDIWFSPLMKSEGARFSTMLRQYAIAFNKIHSTAFGFQRVYLEISGNEEDSWDETTRQAIDSLMTILGRYKFLRESEEPPFRAFFHALSGILILLSLLPGMVILIQTSSMDKTALEDRLLLTCGSTVPFISGLLIAFIWWLILTMPILAFLKIILPDAILYPAFLALFSSFLSMALVMLALGRKDIPTVTVFQLGWGIFFALIVTGGALYPTVLFPDWLRRVFSFTPLHYTTRVVYSSLMKSEIKSSELLLTLWPLLPAMLLGIGKGRRRI